MMKGKIPQSVLKRPKQAYRAPIATALLSGRSAMVEDMLSEKRLKEAQRSGLLIKDRRANGDAYRLSRKGYRVLWQF